MPLPAQNAIPPTLPDIPYGPDERHRIDLWLAEGEGPRPLLVYIHGGGWTTGDKSLRGPDLKPFLDRGISCAAINYRLTGAAPLPAPVHDAARAIQFIKFWAREWNLNPERIALTGGSAGACTSMWLLCHDDLADPKSPDPILQQSTRVAAAAVSAGQTSIDPTVIEDWLGPKVLEHRMIWTSVGAANMAEARSNDAKYRALYVEFSPFNHLSAGDPPLLMTYGNDMTLPSKNGGHGIHHPVYGIKMKEKADAAGVECHLLIPGVSDSPDFASANEFLFAKLLAK